MKTKHKYWNEDFIFQESRPSFILSIHILYPCSLNFLAVPLALNVARRPGKAAAPASTGFGEEAQRKITLHTRHTKMVCFFQAILSTMDQGYQTQQ